MQDLAASVTQLVRTLATTNHQLAEANARLSALQADFARLLAVAQRLAGPP